MIVEAPPVIQPPNSINISSANSVWLNLQRQPLPSELKLPPPYVRQLKTPINQEAQQTICMPEINIIGSSVTDERFNPEGQLESYSIRPEFNQVALDCIPVVTTIVTDEDRQSYALVSVMDPHNSKINPHNFLKPDKKNNSAQASQIYNELSINQERVLVRQGGMILNLRPDLNYQIILPVAVDPQGIWQINLNDRNMFEFNLAGGEPIPLDEILAIIHEGVIENTDSKFNSLGMRFFWGPRIFEVKDFMAFSVPYPDGARLNKLISEGKIAPAEKPKDAGKPFPPAPATPVAEIPVNPYEGIVLPELSPPSQPIVQDAYLTIKTLPDEKTVIFQLKGPDKTGQNMPLFTQSLVKMFSSPGQHDEQIEDLIKKIKHRKFIIGKPIGGENINLEEGLSTYKIIGSVLNGTSNQIFLCQRGSDYFLIDVNGRNWKNINFFAIDFNGIQNNLHSDSLNWMMHRNFQDQYILGEEGKQNGIYVVGSNFTAEFQSRLSQTQEKGILNEVKRVKDIALSDAHAVNKHILGKVTDPTGNSVVSNIPTGIFLSKVTIRKDQNGRLWYHGRFDYSLGALDNPALSDDESRAIFANWRQIVDKAIGKMHPEGELPDKNIQPYYIEVEIPIEDGAPLFELMTSDLNSLSPSDAELALDAYQTSSQLNQETVINRPVVEYPVKNSVKHSIGGTKSFSNKRIFPEHSVIATVHERQLKLKGNSRF